MKRYPILACFLASNMIFGMEQPALTIGDNAQKQQSLLDLIKQYAPNDKINKEELRKLLSEVNINHQYPAHNNETALIRAILRGNPAVVREILATPGLDAHILTRTLDDALHIATADPAALRLLIESKASLNPPLDLNHRIQGGITPLYKACQSGQVEAVRLLCAEPEVNPNISAGEYFSDGNYPLHRAITLPDNWFADHASLLIIRMLADKNAFMECENNKKETPYLLTFRQNDLVPYNRLIALLALGAQKKQLTTAPAIGNNSQPVKLAIEDLVQWLSVTTESGTVAAPLIRWHNGPFLDVCFRAAVKGISLDEKILGLLVAIESKELNRKDAIYGMTALMWASALGHLELVQLLLSLPQIDHMLTDNFGDTALHYAARNGHAKIVELLLECPETLSVLKNNAGATPYDLAKMRGHKAVGRLLGHDRIIQSRILRYFTTQAKNNANAPTGWSFLPEEIAERILAYRAQPIGADGDRMRKIIELCNKRELITS